MDDETAGNEEARIREVLRDHPHGMNIKEISAEVAMSRNSIAKYLDVLVASGNLELRQVGNAKLYTLSRRIPLGTILNLAREMIIVLDRDLRISQANDAFVEFVGIPRDRILGSKLSRLPVPILVETEEAELFRLLQGGPSWKKEIRVVRMGDEVFLEGRFVPAVFENNEYGIAVMLENITAKKLAERGSVESDRLIHTIFQISTVPRFMINMNHNVVYWDRALEIMTRIKSEEMIGTNHHWQAFYPDERPCLADLLIEGKFDEIESAYHDTCRKITVPDISYECIDFYPSLKPAGKWLKVTADVIRDSQGNLVGAMETIEDVTVQKQREFVVDTMEKQPWK